MASDEEEAVIERVEGMPPGTIGFRASGKLTREDYTEGMMPALREAAQSGEMRIVYVIGPDFDGLDSGAMMQDARAGLELGVGHHSAWKRLAMVTDVDWIRHSIHLLGWLSPGELKLFDLDQLEEAKDWAAA